MEKLLFRIPLILIALLLSIPTTFADFPDVSVSHPHHEAITYVQEQGIVNGYEDGTFKPDAPVNRAEFTKIVINSVFYGQAGGTKCFPDVNQEWFAPFVCFAKEKMFLSGYPDGSFKPANRIKFVEAAKIITNIFDYNVAADKNVWYKPYVELLASKGAIPTEVPSFEHELTRGQMAEIIFRMKAHIDSKNSRTYAELAGESQTEEEKFAELPYPEYIAYTQEKYNETLGNRAFVLFFHATWCPTCAKAKKEISADLLDFPNGTYILQADYDTELGLRKQYNVPFQSTFIFFDKSGNEVDRVTTGSGDRVREGIVSSL